MENIQSRNSWKANLFSLVSLVMLIIGLAIGGVIGYVMKKERILPPSNGGGGGSSPDAKDKKEIRRKMLEGWFLPQTEDLYTVRAVVREMDKIDVSKSGEQELEKEVMDSMLKDIALNQTEKGKNLKVNWDTEVNPISSGKRKMDDLYLDIWSSLSATQDEKSYLVKVTDITIENRIHKVMNVPVKAVVGWYDEQANKERKEDIKVADGNYKVIVDLLKKVDLGSGSRLNPLEFVQKELIANIDSQEQGYLDREVEYVKDEYSGLVEPSAGQPVSVTDNYLGKLIILLVPTSSKLSRQMEKFNNVADNYFNLTIRFDTEGSVYFPKKKQDNKYVVKFSLRAKLILNYQENKEKEKFGEISSPTAIFAMRFTEVDPDSLLDLV